MVIPSVSQSIKPSIFTDDPGLSVPVHKTVGDIECYTTYVSVPWIVPAVFRASIATSPLFNTST